MLIVRFLQNANRARRGATSCVFVDLLQVSQGWRNKRYYKGARHYDAKAPIRDMPRENFKSTARLNTALRRTAWGLLSQSFGVSQLPNGQTATRSIPIG